jgi:hypothetical protein
MEGWNMSIVRDLAIRIPPKGLQCNFVQQIRGIEAVVRALDAAAKQAEAMAAALSAEVFA